MKTQKRRENVLDRKLRGGALRATYKSFGLADRPLRHFRLGLVWPKVIGPLNLLSQSLEAFGPSLARGALFFGTTTRPKSH